MRPRPSLPTSDLLRHQPDTGPLGERLVQNTPTDPTTVPLPVAQGTGDEVIPITVTEQWVAQRWRGRPEIRLPDLPDRTIVGPSSPTRR